MIGWLMLIAIAMFAGLLLWAMGFPPRQWTVAATALTLGATGYAWQGSPQLEGHAVSAEGKTGEIDPGEVELREAMFGRFNFSWSYFNAADAMTRGGNPAAAVQWMQGGAIKSPQDAALWTGLGMKLAEHDQGVSPASKFAFDKAIALWPKHPGPVFFLGLAYAKMGQYAEARPYWVKAIELTPESTSYRATMVLSLQSLDERIAAQAARQRQDMGLPPETAVTPTPTPSPSATPAP